MTVYSKRGTPYLLGVPKPSKNKKKDAKRKKEKEELLKTVAEEAG